MINDDHAKSLSPSWLSNEDSAERRCPNGSARTCTAILWCASLAGLLLRVCLKIGDPNISLSQLQTNPQEYHKISKHIPPTK